MTSPLNAFLISRRHVLQGGAALSAVALAGRSAFAAPAKPLTFIGWQYHPEIVDQNVDTFKKLYDESVTYELVSGDYHPVVETKLTGGQHVDMMYSEEDHIARWNAADWTRDLEGLPDIDAIKAAMFPVAVASLSLPSGKIAGLPYYAGHNAFIYNEEHLSKAGLQVPDSWDTSARRLPQAQEGRDLGRALQQRLGPEMARAILEPVFLLVRGGRARLRRQERFRRRRLPPQGP